MGVPTRSNRERNARAGWAVVVGLLSLAAVPAAIAASHWAPFELLYSGYAIRYGAVVLSGVLASLGGAYLSIGFGGGTFTDNMTAGRGFIALAAMIFGNWRPFGAFGAAVLFGLSSAIALRLQVYSASASTLFNVLPYVLTLIAVGGVIGRTVPPAADGKPYQKQ